MTTVLVTGAAGYIGSHACKALAAAGHRVVAFDNLSSGWRQSLAHAHVFEEGDIRDRARLDEVLTTHRPEAVFHFAALIEVGVSVKEPDAFWSVNVAGTMVLLDAMAAAGIGKLIFSSTCAVHGTQDGVMLSEGSPFSPESPYAETKLAVEMMVAGYARKFPLRALGFRYFNVAGADGDAELGEFHQPETHVIPLVLQTLLGQRDSFSIFGDDYPTADGTCIRDYVHVADLVDAHVSALDYLDRDDRVPILTLGTGRGFSVKEVVATAEEVTGKKVPHSIASRRAGDPASLVCGSKLAADALGWAPHRSTLPRMIADAWAWHQGPGYTS